jgi:predicted HTH domain antitoxin
MVAISEQILQAAQISEEELRVEIAVLLYQRGLDLPQSASVAQMHRLDFQKLLADRRIAMHYDIEDLEQDVQTLDALFSKTWRLSVIPLRSSI